MKTLCIFHIPDTEFPANIAEDPDSIFLAIPPVTAPSKPSGTNSWRLPQDYIGAEGLMTEERDALTWLKSRPHVALDKRGSLHSRMAMGSVSLWWFIEASLYRQVIKHIAKWLTVIKLAIEKEKAGRIYFFDDSSLFSAAVVAAAKAAGIEACSIGYKEQSWLGRLRGIVNKPTFKWLAVLARDILRKLLNATVTTQKKMANQKIRLLVGSMGRERRSYDLVSRRWVTEDLILAPVLDSLDEDKLFQVKFLYKFPYPGRLKIPASFLRHNFDISIWENYLGGSVHGRIRRKKHEFGLLMSELWSDRDFQSLWIYKGINIWEIMCHPFSRIWHWELNLAIRYLELSEQLMETYKPQAVLIASETSLDNKALVIAANRRGIPVTALQQGTIVAADDWLADYSVGPKDLDGLQSKSWFYPSVTCLFGEETRRLVIDEMGYPYPDALSVTGQPRFDSLARITDPEDYQELRHSLGIPSGKKVVLIGSQTFNILGNKEVFLNAIYDSLRDQPDIVIVVKPHPLESTKYHEKFANRLNIKPLILPRNVDIQEAIKCSSVLITSYSTVAIEAMMAGRPVITVNLSGFSDIVPYADEGASLGINQVDKILPGIRSVLDEPDFRKTLLLGARRYLDREFALCDGESTSRLIETLKMNIHR